jgi:hypothetical protein
MSSSGQITLADIWAMLDRCAPGHTRQQRVHNWVVKYQDKTFPNLPVGKHGARRHVSIQVGHIKKMIRALGIEDCAKQQIPLLA